MASDRAEFVERVECPACGGNELTDVATGHFGDSPLRELIENDPWGESPLPYIAESEWRFVQCVDCSLRFHQRVLSPEWNKIRYERWTTRAAMDEFDSAREGPADEFERARKNVEHALRLEKQTRELRGNERLRLLDYGFGWSPFLAMCQLFGFTAVGIDRSASSTRGGPSVTILPQIDDLAKAPETGDGFHVLTLFETLEQLEEPLRSLNELSRHMLPGGILVLETSDCRGVAGIETERDYRLIHPLENINAFDPKTLRAIARRAGFAPIEKTIVQVNSEPHRVLKREIKRVVSPLMRPTTQLYFRKFR